MPACRQMSLTGTPASACLRIETIWVSVKRDFFMEPPGWGKHARKFCLWGVCGSGKLTHPQAEAGEGEQEMLAPAAHVQHPPADHALDVLAAVAFDPAHGAVAEAHRLLAQEHDRGAFRHLAVLPGARGAAPAGAARRWRHGRARCCRTRPRPG